MLHLIPQWRGVANSVQAHDFQLSDCDNGMVAGYIQYRTRIWISRISYVYIYVYHRHVFAIEDTSIYGTCIYVYISVAQTTKLCFCKSNERSTT